MLRNEDYMPEKLKLNDEDAGRFDDLDLSDIVIEIDVPTPSEDSEETE